MKAMIQFYDRKYTTDHPLVGTRFKICNEPLIVEEIVGVSEDGTHIICDVCIPFKSSESRSAMKIGIIEHIEEYNDKT